MLTILAPSNNPRQEQIIRGQRSLAQYSNFSIIFSLGLILNYYYFCTAWELILYIVMSCGCISSFSFACFLPVNIRLCAIQFICAQHTFFSTSPIETMLVDHYILLVSFLLLRSSNLMFKSNKSTKTTKKRNVYFECYFDENTPSKSC